MLRGRAEERRVMSREGHAHDGWRLDERLGVSRFWLQHSSGEEENTARGGMMLVCIECSLGCWYDMPALRWGSREGDTKR